MDAWHQSEQKDVLTNVFSELGSKPSRLSLDQINMLEKFVLEIYAVRKVESLTQASLDKFMISTGNDLRKLPPSREASLIVYVEENVTMYNLVMLSISNYF